MHPLLIPYKSQMEKFIKDNPNKYWGLHDCLHFLEGMKYQGKNNQSLLHESNQDVPREQIVKEYFSNESSLQFNNINAGTFRTFYCLLHEYVTIDFRIFIHENYQDLIIVPALKGKWLWYIKDTSCIRNKLIKQSNCIP